MLHCPPDQQPEPILPPIRDGRLGRGDAVCECALATRGGTYGDRVDAAGDTGTRGSAIVFESDLPGDAVSMTLDGFKAGRYSLRLVREDVSKWDWVVREPEGNVVAVFTGYERIKTDAEGLARMADRWLEEGWRDLDQPLPETYFSPQVEARVASFWNLVPFARDRSTVNFALEVDGPIHVVVLPNDVVPVKALRIERVMTE